MSPSKKQHNYFSQTSCYQLGVLKKINIGFPSDFKHVLNITKPHLIEWHGLVGNLIQIMFMVK